MLTLVIIIILIALIFDFINGFHDAANSIATVVSTRVLTPRFAVMWAAFFNFIGAFGFETHVAKTMGNGMIQLNAVNEYVILAGLIGAIVWDLITWYFGLPTSSSHALIGAYAGAAIARSGFSAIIAAGWTKTLIFIVLSPIIGGLLGFSMMVIVLWLFRHFTPSSVDKYFGRLQLVSAGLFSLGHGVNDAQKTMGIIAGLLFTSGYLPNPTIPFWVVLLCHAAIGLGTMSGGWRIVKTMGQKNYQAQACGRVLCGDGRRDYVVGHRLWRYTGQHHPHHHRSHHGRGSHQAPLIGALGCGQHHCLGLGLDDSPLGADRCAHLFLDLEVRLIAAGGL